MADIFKKSVRNQIIDNMNEQKIGYVSFFNDGSNKTDTNSKGKLMKLVTNDYYVNEIEDLFVKAASFYNFRYDSDLDFVKMYLLLGLMYRKEDVDDNNNIKEGAKPIDNIVRYYTYNIDGYLNNEQINATDYSESHYTSQGFLRYNGFVRRMDNSDFLFHGPRNFDEFKKQILSKEPFDISLELDLSQGMKLTKHM